MAKTNLITPSPAIITYIYDLKPVDAPDLVKRSPGSVPKENPSVSEDFPVKNYILSLHVVSGPIPHSPR